jgi:hypothetical protein
MHTCRCVLPHLPVLPWPAAVQLEVASCAIGFKTGMRPADTKRWAVFCSTGQLQIWVSLLHGNQPCQPA